MSESFVLRCPSLKRTVALLTALVFFISFNAPLVAQNVPDIEPPVIAIEAVDTAVADITQVFTAQASDDQALGIVSLHHRRSGEIPFKRSVMEAIGDSGFFSVVIDTDPEDLRNFEYYVQALDLNGNRTVSGFAFEPFVRTLTSNTDAGLVATIESGAGAEETTPEPVPDVAIAATPEPIVTPKPTSTSSTRRWVYIGLGVLVAGAVASQLGGDSDGGGAVSDGTVPFTVNTQEPF